ncbi:MAG: hypothetical protein E7175_05890 [Erysipelotrichaceae bacterium]|nr:hypothetical protein [Erysipelotrichaceae bacterium]
MDKNVALVLEGGGVKCAYQVGAMMALEENGYKFNAISGASFGALNGALYIEGGIKKLFDYYTNLQTKDIFNNEKLCDFVNNYNGDKSNFTNAYLGFIREHVPEAFNDRKEASDYYHSYVAHQVNEEAVLKSPIEFMFSVLEVNNNPLVLPLIIGSYFARNLSPLQMMINNGTIKPRIINKLDCPRGTLAMYIAASANYPFFNPIEVEDKYYLDGGITTNTPYKALLEAGYKKLVIIRTKSDELQGKIPQNDDILVITPSENLGSSIQFTHDNIMEFIKLGYSDTSDMLHHL